MHPDEWQAIAAVIRDRWFAIDETETAEWFRQLADLDGGLVAQALIGMADRGETPTASLIRRSVNAIVREQADAAPHPATSGYLSFSEWLRRGAPAMPGYEDEADRERVIEAILEITQGEPVFS